MVDCTRTVRGVPVPTFIYGTAWKEELTGPLVARSLHAGFRGIDTANQRKHYHEAGVGVALTRSFERGALRRDELFVQTKFTFPAGQDHRIPYDRHASVAEQVEQSFESSLEHLGVERIDSYVLHGPTVSSGLGDADREAWRAMEALHEDGRARLIGVSNVRPDQLELLCEFAEVPPAFVQNRCFARMGWDAEVRRVCDERSIVYQGFSLLTANPEVLGRPALADMAERHERTRPQLIFRFALQLGMIPLTGTKDPRHMEQALEVYDFELSDEEIAAIEGMGA
ncbi:MAG TPA: aldo/keto reductase [Gemmatimonadota bacterium]|nr:aldo/keto reductase [Gemmatimonadota bacterium]